jgi:hypothetical protein
MTEAQLAMTRAQLETTETQLAAQFEAQLELERMGTGGSGLMRPTPW